MRQPLGHGAFWPRGQAANDTSHAFSFSLKCQPPEASTSLPSHFVVAFACLTRAFCRDRTQDHTLTARVPPTDLKRLLSTIHIDHFQSLACHDCNPLQFLQAPMVHWTWNTAGVVIECKVWASKTWRTAGSVIERKVLDCWAQDEDSWRWIIPTMWLAKCRRKGSVPKQSWD